MKGSLRVFISYARSDGEAFAEALRKRLADLEPSVTIWRDREKLEGGVGWWKQIEAALDVVEVMVLVMTPAAMRSDVAQKEWRYARQQGVRVYPVKGVADSAIDWDALPQWMRKAHFFDLHREWDTFTNYLKSPGSRERVPFMAPDLPAGYVARSEPVASLLRHLIGPRGEPRALTAAVRGAGGIGKTTLAAAVCHHEEVIAAFDDGILWVTLGQNPSPTQALLKLYAALTGERPAFVDEEDAAFHLFERLANKTCLIVIDDVWDASHLRPFLRGGRSCARLVTTRQLDTVSGAEQMDLAEMTPEEAVELLTARLDRPAAGRPGFLALAERLDRWPLILELAAAALQHRVGRGDTIQGALQHLGLRLDRQGLLAFDQRNPTERHQAIANTIEASLEALEAEERLRLTELSIFPEDTSLPLAVVASLWQFDSLDAEDLVLRFDNLSLLRFDLRGDSIRLHDVVRGYLGTRLEDKASLHGFLIDAWGDLAKLSSPYAWSQLSYHLVEAGREAELRRLLLDFDWLQAKLEARGVTELIEDFDWLPDDADLSRIQASIRLSAHLLASDPTQLAAQLLGRLAQGENPGLAGLLRSARSWRGKPWLRPVSPRLAPPGGPLRSTLSGHEGPVRSIAIDSSGRRVVSGSDDGTVRVWDLVTGAEQRTLAAHADWVRCVALSPDGSRVISASDDQTVRVWNLDSGAMEQSIDTAGDRIGALTLTRDGRVLVVAADDFSLRVFNLESGGERAPLCGHRARVNALAVTPEGRLISASDDRTLRLWDLGFGTEIAKLVGHTGRVRAVVVSQDGAHAVSAASDETIRRWPLGSGSDHEPETLTRDAYWVRSLAVSADGRRVVCGTEDNAIRVWSANSGQKELELDGHTDWVHAVALTPDDGRVVSGSGDGTLKVWDLESSQPMAGHDRHLGRVRVVAVTQDGARAFTSADDLTLRIWDVERASLEVTVPDLSHWPFAPTPDGRHVVVAASEAMVRVIAVDGWRECGEFRGHRDRIRALAVTPCGTRVVSAGDDQTIRLWTIADGREQLRIQLSHTWVRGLAIAPGGQAVLSASERPGIKVWSLEDGRQQLTLRGHEARVNAVVVTPDGREAISASDDHTVRLWDLRDGSEKAILEGHDGRIRGLAVSCDGHFAASASDDSTLCAWWLPNRTLVARFTGESPFLACALARRDNTLIAGDQNGRVHFLVPEIPSR